MPPLGLYEWFGTIDADKAKLLVTPGYDSPEFWDAPFSPDPDALVKWCNEIVDRPNDDEVPVGSGGLRVVLTTANGKNIMSNVGGEVSPPIGLAIPEQQFDEPFAEFEKWQKEQM